MHMLTNLETWEKLKAWHRELDRKEESFRGVHRIGFSYHGNTEDFCELVDAYDWDFCMISIIIWMKTVRQDERVCSMLRQRDFR